MKLKSIVEIAIEKVTNRNCEKCAYNKGICTRNDKKGEKCRECIFPCGYVQEV